MKITGTGPVQDGMAGRSRLHSASVLEQIQALALQHLHGVLPGSLLGKALHYLTAQWPKLARYVDDGRYPIVSVQPSHLELR